MAARREEEVVDVFRAEKQTETSRGQENRKVRVYLDEDFDFSAYNHLMVTHSSAEAEQESTHVGYHRHPNTVELIIFHQPGRLEIDGEMHSFDPNDVAVIHPGELHGANDLESHDCTCVLISTGSPQKTP